MRYCVRTICVVFLGLALASSAWSQSLRVGYVDMKRVLDNAPQVLAGRQQLDQEFRERTAGPGLLCRHRAAPHG